MTKNANQHSKTKHIEIRYHLLRDHFEKGDIDIDYVSTDLQLADIFTNHLILLDFLSFVVKLMFVLLNKNVFLTLFDV